MPVFFIVNPAAGKSDIWKRFEPHLGPEAVVKVTERRGHAEELARQALKSGFDRVAAVGGDGTLNEVANGVLSAGSLPSGFALAHLPAGSGCDFARHFHIPAKPAAWLEFLHHGRVERIDVGRVSWGNPQSSRYFLNIAMAGLPGEVIRAMEKSGKPLGGTLSYMTVTLAELIRSKAKRITLIIDGREHPPEPYHLLAVANTSMTGGGMLLAPGADATDGMLDFVAVGGVALPRLLWHFPKIYRGTHLGVGGVIHCRVMRLDAESAEEVSLNIDGEPLGSLPARFQVSPRALPILLP
ncbi:MAG: diacylglycerol kinase family lipid kinase [Elusimicrobia bacterium]|nr:diacylglycerol kinase family lipid kinase [Elusimicrobiota bacterium]